jgi:hypothetical protein
MKNILTLISLLLPLQFIHSENNFYYFDNEGAKEFEQICDKPIKTIDCRKDNLEFLSFKGVHRFKLDNYNEDFYKMYFEDLNYYIVKNKFDYYINQKYFYTSLENLKESQSIFENKLNGKYYISTSNTFYNVCESSLTFDICENSSNIDGFIDIIDKVEEDNSVFYIFEYKGDKYSSNDFILIDLIKKIKAKKTLNK